MFQSRCGVRCDQCQRKEQVHCLGCAAMEKPFWGGVCGVKACCEEKALDHCGLCPQFPCAMCAAMGKDAGYDVEGRLETCRQWAKERVGS